MKHKCYEAVWSISREMETSSQMNLLCTDDNDVCPHLVQGERVDVEVLYRLDGVEYYDDEVGCVEESHNCVDDFDYNNLEDSISYSCFGYDEYPVLEVLARNCSGRILFWKLVLDLYMEEHGGVVHFDGNWICAFLPGTEQATNAFLKPALSMMETLSKKTRTDVYFRLKIIKGPVIMFHDPILTQNTPFAFVNLFPLWSFQTLQ